MVDWSVVEHSVGASAVTSTVCLPLWHLPFVSTAKTRWVSSSVIQWLLTSWTALLRRVFLARSSCSPHADSPHLPTFFLAYFMLTSSSPLERCTQRFRLDHFERLERLKKSLFARSSSNFSTEASVCSHFFRLISVLGSKNLVDAFSSKHSQLNWMNRIKWPETAFPMNKPIHLIIHQAAMLLANIRPNRRPQAAISLWFTVVERGSNCDGRGEQPGDRASGKFGRLLGAWRSDAFALSSQTVDGRGEEVWKTLWKFEDLWTPRGVFEEAGRTPASCWIVYKIRRSLLKWLKWLLSQHFNFPLFVPMIGGRCFGLQNWGNLS